MGWERKGCFVSQGMAKPDVEKGGEIFRFWLKTPSNELKADIQSVTILPAR